jgi:hypothetical protein
VIVTRGLMINDVNTVDLSRPSIYRRLARFVKFVALCLCNAYGPVVPADACFKILALHCWIVNREKVARGAWRTRVTGDASLICVGLAAT